ncbi:hypothetical protein QJS04_geneDACA000724 [Acorus gramineus]|uniref:Uncharacterized protein n=1 Tax=Acorus gramineus TaxID=55184 RepID=A0AAV9APG1_ACOGR|nr:hypothetical protein QJS04_geneDACA000724 [Acorus gramineus]
MVVPKINFASRLAEDDILRLIIPVSLEEIFTTLFAMKTDGSFGTRMFPAQPPCQISHPSLFLRSLLCGHEPSFTRQDLQKGGKLGMPLAFTDAQAMRLCKNNIHKKSLWMDWVWNRYLLRNSLWAAEANSGSSWAWSQLLRNRDWIDKGFLLTLLMEIL